MVTTLLVFVYIEPGLMHHVLFHVSMPFGSAFLYEFVELSVGV